MANRMALLRGQNSVVTDVNEERRRLLRLASVGGMLLAIPMPRAIAAVDSRFLGQPWRVPGNAVHEVWPSKLGMDLGACLAAVADWEVPLSAFLTIRLEDGVHRQERTLKIRHSAGDRLRIVGNRAAPDRCRLVWQGEADGVYVGAGVTLGIEGVSVVHDGKAKRGEGSGVLADEGGVVICGAGVRVMDFYYGFQARRSGAIRCDDSRSSGAGDANYFAFMGGHISARGAVAREARDDQRGLGSGFVAEYGGTIDAVGALAEDNALAGFTALSNGTIRAYRSRAEQNGRAGYLADTGGQIVVHDGMAKGNCGPGVISRERANAVTGNNLRVQANDMPSTSCEVRGRLSK